MSVAAAQKKLKVLEGELVEVHSEMEKWRQQNISTESKSAKLRLSEKLPELRARLAETDAKVKDARVELRGAKGAVERAKVVKPIEGDAAVVAAGKKVEGLERERVALVAKMEKLEGQKVKAKTSDLGKIAGQLAELRSVLPVVDQRLELARLDLKDAKQKVNEAAILELRAVEADQWAVAKALVLGELTTKMRALALTQSHLAMLGAGARCGDRCVFDMCRELQELEWQRSGDYTGHPWRW